MLHRDLPGGAYFRFDTNRIYRRDRLQLGGTAEGLHSVDSR